VNPSISATTIPEFIACALTDSKSKLFRRRRNAVVGSSEVSVGQWDLLEQRQTDGRSVAVKGEGVISGQKVR
jgi:hypothetical protein